MYSANDIRHLNLFWNDGLMPYKENNADISVGSGLSVYIEPLLALIDGSVITRYSTKIIVGTSYNKNKNKNLIKIILKSRKWNKEIMDGATVSDIVERENVSDRYVHRLLNISFLSPKITTAILEGTQPSDLTIEKLETIKIYNWKEQEKIIFSQ